MSGKLISHEGIVEKIDKSGICIKLAGNYACSGCHAKGVCSLSGEQEKRLILPHSNDQVCKGDKVSVIFSESLGFRALFLGYLLPFLLVMTILLLMSVISDNELMNGLASLAILLPYFLLIRFFRDRISRRFQFTLSKN